MTNYNQTLNPGADYNRDARLELEEAVRECKPYASEKVRSWIESSKTPDAMKAFAASLTPTLSGVEVEQTLVSALSGNPAALVSIHICRALAFVGTSSSLAAIEVFVEDKNPRIREAARFAHIIISHRLGQPSPYLTIPEGDWRTPFKGPACGFVSHQLSSNRIGEVCKAVGRYPAMGEIHAQAGIEISCGTARWAIVFQDKIIRESCSEAIGRKPALLCAVLEFIEEHRNWAVGRVVVGGPIDRDRFYVAAFRRSGALDMFGSGPIEEPLIQLHAVNRPGSLPTLLVAHWHGVRISISGVSGLQRTAKNLARAITPPVLSPSPELPSTAGAPSR